MPSRTQLRPESARRPRASIFIQKDSPAKKPPKPRPAEDRKAKLVRAGGKGRVKIGKSSRVKP